jgi:hypothetical protein
MGIGLSGSLEDFGIADVFQLIGQQRKTGMLELVSGNRRIQLLFSDGGVVSAAPAVGRATDTDPLGDMLVRCGALTRDQAETAQRECRAAAQTLANTVIDSEWASAEEVRAIEELLTRNTIFEVLRWESGTFDFRAQDVEHGRDSSTLLAAEQILMDGLRMVDEWRAFGHLVRSDADVFQRVGRFETYAESLPDATPEKLERAQRLFSMIDGRLSARRIIDLSRLGNFDGTRILAGFREAGLIKPMNPEGVRQLQRHSRARRGRGTTVGRLRVVLATALPLILLTTLAALSGGAPAVPEPGRVEMSSLERLQEAYATRRVRKALDAYRFVEGDWPPDLQELAIRGFLSDDALTPPLSRPYYSARRADGVVVLAPEH